MTKDNAMTNRVKDRTVSKTERVVIPKEYDDGFDVVMAPDGQPAIVERGNATPDRVARAKWESIRGSAQLVNEPGSGVRLTIECNEHTSQVKNKAEIAAEMRRILGLKPRSLLR